MLAKEAPTVVDRWRFFLVRFFSKRTQRVLCQSLLLALFICAIAWISHNVLDNLQRLGMKTGFGFLSRPAGFEISQALVFYDDSSTYGKAFVVALLNTVSLALLAIGLATVIGFLIALTRISFNPLLRAVGLGYVELLRNIPLLIQLLFWYFAVLQMLPGPSASIHISDWLYLNNRGLFLPAPNFGAESGWWTLPRLQGFNFVGGFSILPELFAMILGLSLYSAAFTAEIMRAGIVAIVRGQIDAALALGLTRWQVLRLVVVPQALKNIVPPLGAYYVVILKNTSLGCAIAYPELMLVFAGTVLNQTGQPIDVMSLTLLTYLGLGLAMAAVTNLINRRVLR